MYVRYVGYNMHASLIVVVQSSPIIQSMFATFLLFKTMVHSTQTISPGSNFFVMNGLAKLVVAKQLFVLISQVSARGFFKSSLEDNLTTFLSNGHRYSDSV